MGVVEYFDHEYERKKWKGREKKRTHIFLARNNTLCGSFLKASVYFCVNIFSFFLRHCILCARPKPQRSEKAAIVQKKKKKTEEPSNTWSVAWRHNKCKTTLNARTWRELLVFYIVCIYFCHCSQIILMVRLHGIFKMVTLLHFILSKLQLYQPNLYDILSSNNGLSLVFLDFVCEARGVWGWRFFGGMEGWLTYICRLGATQIHSHENINNV